MGDRGNRDAHRLLAEYRVRTQGRGRTVDEWKPRPERSDNHFLDCLVGAAVAGSMCGCSALSSQDASPKQSTGRRWSELAAGKSGQHETQTSADEGSRCGSKVTFDLAAGGRAKGNALRRVRVSAHAGVIHAALRQEDVPRAAVPEL